MRTYTCRYCGGQIIFRTLAATKTVLLPQIANFGQIIHSRKAGEPDTRQPGGIVAHKHTEQAACQSEPDDAPLAEPEPVSEFERGDEHGTRLNRIAALCT